ncbi:MAG: ABC transporter permease [Clostridium sp.]
MIKYFRSFFGKYIFVFAFILIWELCSRLKILNPVFVPPFSRVLLEVIKMVQSGELIKNLGVSILRAVTGLLIAVFIGISTGFILGIWLKKLKTALDMLLEIFSQINPFLVYHVIAIILGIGEITRITIVVWTCIWPILFSTMLGISKVNKEILKMGRSFALNKINLFVKIIMPACAPYIFAGIRLSGGYSLLILIAAEIMGARKGIGTMIVAYEHNFQLIKMYSVVSVICFIALIIDFILEKIEKNFIKTEENALNSEL